MRVRRSGRLALGGMLIVSGLVACSASNSSQPSAAFCEANASVAQEMSQLNALVSSNAASSDITAQLGKVMAAADKAAGAAGNVSQSLLSDVQAADAAFTQAVQGVPGDATVSEASAQYNAASGAWQQAVAPLRSQAGCQ